MVSEEQEKNRRKAESVEREAETCVRLRETGSLFHLVPSPLRIPLFHPLTAAHPAATNVHLSRVCDAEPPTHGTHHLTVGLQFSRRQNESLVASGPAVRQSQQKPTIH